MANDFVAPRRLAINPETRMVRVRQDKNLLNALRLNSYYRVGLLLVISCSAAATIYPLARLMGWGG